MRPQPETAADPGSVNIPFWIRFLIGAPLTLFGGLITSLFTITVVCYLLSRVCGGRPASSFMGWMVAWIVFGVGPLWLGLVTLLASRSSKRFWIRTSAAAFLLGALAIVDGAVGPNNWHHVFRRETLPGSDAAELNRTLVTPHLRHPIAKGTNVLWCGTFQLAWNAMTAHAGGTLRFDRTNSVITALNDCDFTSAAIDESSYVALAGSAGDGIHGRIRKTIEQKFNGSFQPRLLPQKTATALPGDWIAYACLFKKLTFETPFSSMANPLTLEGELVPAFGVDRSSDSPAKLYSQIAILDYASAEDFVIELKTTSAGDRLILAKLSPGQDLFATVTNVMSRIEQGRGELTQTNDVLIVPRIKLDLTRRFAELEGLKLVAPAPRGSVQTAVQNIAFEMNERGAELRSEAEFSIACAGPPPREHIMIFNQPFLVMLQRTNATIPYFALWVDNPEVLVCWK